MNPILIGLGLTLATGVTLAAERGVTLAVERLDCPTCPYIISQSLAAVPGVREVTVSFAHKTATVVFDDAITGVEALTAATAKLGFPSRPVED